MSPPFGVYVHFPYCAVHCPYCDFAVSTDRPIPQERYTRAVLAELAQRAPAFDALLARSLYLGGGTPSLWDPDRVGEVIAAVRARFELPPGAEVTLEANPESCDPARLRAYRDAGVNRVSIGVQSFDPGVLAKLGRRHGPDAAERAIRAAAEALPNVAVDLIYGARRSSVATARADAERLASLPVAHVSAYGLTLDGEVLAEETPLARLRRAGRLPLPSDDDVVAQARAIHAVLRRAGLRRYEISNLALPGREAVHNRLYWDSESYLGGGAAHAGAPHARRPPHPRDRAAPPRRGRRARARPARGARRRQARPHLARDGGPQRRRRAAPAVKEGRPRGEEAGPRADIRGRGRRCCLGPANCERRCASALSPPGRSR